MLQCSYIPTSSYGLVVVERVRCKFRAVKYPYGKKHSPSAPVLCTPFKPRNTQTSSSFSDNQASIVMRPSTHRKIRVAGVGGNVQVCDHMLQSIKAWSMPHRCHINDSPSLRSSPSTAILEALRFSIASESRTSNGTEILG